MKYRPNQNYFPHANTHQWNKFDSSRQSRHTELHNCTRLPKSSYFRQNKAQLQTSGLKMTSTPTMLPKTRTMISDYSAIISNASAIGTKLTLLNQLPAHAIICDFSLQVALFLSACYKTLLFLISHCWQVIMARTKSKMTNGHVCAQSKEARSPRTSFLRVPP